MVTAPTSASQLHSTVGRIRKHLAGVLSNSAWIRITALAGRKVNMIAKNQFHLIDITRKNKMFSLTQSILRPARLTRVYMQYFVILSFLLAS
jgi:hypothetical protein